MPHPSLTGTALAGWQRAAFKAMPLAPAAQAARFRAELQHSGAFNPTFKTLRFDDGRIHIGPISIDPLNPCGDLPSWVPGCGDGETGGPTLGCPPGSRWPGPPSPSNVCVPNNGGGDPTPIGNTPAEGSGGIRSPMAVDRRVLQCPRFADGKTGILWMQALTGEVVCLPRGTNGKGFGLIRKNKPRRPAYISAHQKSLLNKITAIQGKAKSFATDAGFSCFSRAGQARPAKRKKS